jgi:putative transposase
MQQEATKVIKLQLNAPKEIFRSTDGQSRICNWLYNHLLDKANRLRQEFIQTGKAELAKTLYTERGLRNLLPSLKKEFPFLKSVHSSPLKNTALRLSQAIQARQQSKKGKRRGKEVGWPRFRSWQTSWFSLLFDEPGKGFKVRGDILQLSLGMGDESKRQSLFFTLKESHLLKNQKIRNLRLVKQAGIYYAVFTVQVLLAEKKQIERVIAVDPNHKNMAYGVDTEGRAIEIAAPRWLKLYDKRIDELKSKRDRCDKRAKKIVVTDAQGNPTGKEILLPSKRWQKYHRTLEKALHKRQEQTKTFVYTLAHRLCRYYDCIGIGDYTPHGNGETTLMRRAMNNRSLIGRFKEALMWVALKSGKTCIEYEEEGTTRTCHRCDYVNAEGLCPSIRYWECPDCQAFHVRDENAAQNGLKRILRDLAKKSGTLVSLVPSSGLDSVIERWAWRVLPSGVQKHSAGARTAIRSQRQEIKLKA